MLNIYVNYFSISPWRHYKELYVHNSNNHTIEMYNWSTLLCFISITIEHCNSIIDLFSRAGRLNEAIAMLEKMPCEPDPVTWTIMLGACQNWGNLELGKRAFDGASRMDMGHAASFVLMSNIVCQWWSICEHWHQQEDWLNIPFCTIYMVNFVFFIV